MRTGPGWEKRTGPLHIWDFRGRRAPSDHRGWGLSPGKWEDSTPWAHAGFSPSVPLTAQPPPPPGPFPARPGVRPLWTGLHRPSLDLWFPGSSPE